MSTFHALQRLPLLVKLERHVFYRWHQIPPSKADTVAQLLLLVEDAHQQALQSLDAPEWVPRGSTTSNYYHLQRYNTPRTPAA